MADTVLNFLENNWQKCLIYRFFWIDYLQRSNVKCNVTWIECVSSITSASVNDNLWKHLEAKSARQQLVVNQRETLISAIVCETMILIKQYYDHYCVVTVNLVFSTFYTFIGFYWLISKQRKTRSRHYTCCPIHLMVPIQCK